MPTIARLSLKHAAEALDVSKRTLQRFIATGHFSAQYPRGKGLGKPCFLLKSEVEAAVLDWSTATRRAELKLWKSRRA